MTPNDLDNYLRVLAARAVGSAMIKLPDGAEIHVSFVPQLPTSAGDDPVPGGWKTGSLSHLDDVGALRDLGDSP